MISVWPGWLGPTGVRDRLRLRPRFAELAPGRSPRTGPVSVAGSPGAALVVAMLLWAGCGPGERGSSAFDSGAAAVAAEPAAASLRTGAAQQPAGETSVRRRDPADTAFAALIARLSEPGGFFDTDNLISNERSYLHVIGVLEERGVQGGAFIGVGPDQSFSYMATLRPAIAYIIDIRRDNLLQHLWFKALFELSPTRVEFLSLMFGRSPPDDPSDWADASAGDLAAWIDSQAYDSEYEARLWIRMQDAVASMQVPLTVDDLATIGTIHHQFSTNGLDLRFTSHFRGPRPGYPTYRDLLMETDLSGKAASYLATESRYRFIRGLQLADRVVPVVGDLAGPSALRAIGADARARNLAVSAFYTSNVEFYLMRAGTFDAFAANVASLPIDATTLIIRSYFNRFDARLPQSRAGYTSTQLLQPADLLLETWEGEGFTGYWDLITRHSLPLR